jgi:hypothetical protein
VGWVGLAGFAASLLVSSLEPRRPLLHEGRLSRVVAERQLQVLDAAASVGEILRSRIAASLRKVSSAESASLDRADVERQAETGLTGRELLFRDLVDRTTDLLQCAWAAEAAARVLLEFGPDGVDKTEVERRKESAASQAETVTAEVALAMQKTGKERDR